MKCYICGEETYFLTSNDQPICLQCAEKKGFSLCTELGKYIEDGSFACPHDCAVCDFKEKRKRKRKMAQIKVCPRCGVQNPYDAEVCAACQGSLADAVVFHVPEKIEYSTFAKIIRIIGWIIYIVGFIAGIFLSRDRYDDFNFLMMFAYWVAGFVTGSLTIGFSEMIRLLHEINQKIK